MAARTLPTIMGIRSFGDERSQLEELWNEAIDWFFILNASN